jgi:hypothetical protein
VEGGKEDRAVNTENKTTCSFFKSLAVYY